MIVGAALGPLPLGVARDLLGSYNLALTLLAVLPFALGVANLFWGKPEK
jgi:cyanate permease